MSQQSLPALLHGTVDCDGDERHAEAVANAGTALLAAESGWEARKCGNVDCGMLFKSLMLLWKEVSAEGRAGVASLVRDTQQPMHSGGKWRTAEGGE